MNNFVPREIDPEDNVNVSKGSEGREFLTLLGGLIIFVLTLYVILGLAVNILIATIPDKIEDMLGATIDLSSFDVDEEDRTTSELYVQGLVDELVSNLPEDQQKEYTVHVVESEDVNALALPGRNIIIFSALLDQIDSENELVMILGHELGHFVNQDHLKGLGRGLVFMVVSTVIMGSNSSVANLISGILSTADLKFSRQQELSADRHGLKLLNSKYGHVAGAKDFFRRSQEESEIPRWLGFMSTHPIGESRILKIENLIDENQYDDFAQVVPLEETPLRQNQGDEAKE